MPANLTDVDAFTDPVVVPAAGDPAAAGPGSYLRAALQALTNRTRWLKNLVETTGVPQIRNVANITALKALTATTGSVAIVAGSQLYFFKVGAAAGSGQDLNGIRYDAGDASGAWFSPIAYITNGSASALRMDNAILTVPNRVSDIIFSSALAVDIATNVDGTGVWVSKITVQRSLAVGDRVQLQALGGFVQDGDPVFPATQIRLRASGPSGAAAFTASEKAYHLIQDKSVFMATAGTYTASETGDHDLQVQFKLDTGGGDYSVACASLTLQGLILRP